LLGRHGQFSVVTAIVNPSSGVLLVLLCCCAAACAIFRLTRYRQQQILFVLFPESFLSP
jgi:hypothetical protein